MRKQTKLFEMGNFTLTYVKDAVGETYFNFKGYEYEELFQQSDISDLVLWLIEECGINPDGIAKMTSPVSMQQPSIPQDNPTKSVVDESKIPSADDLSKRSAGGVEHASKLNVGNAFKAPGDYADGKRQIMGVETTDLGKFAHGAAIVEVQSKLM